MRRKYIIIKADQISFFKCSTGLLAVHCSKQLWFSILWWVHFQTDTSWKWLDYDSCCHVVRSFVSDLVLLRHHPYRYSSAMTRIFHLNLQSYSYKNFHQASRQHNHTIQIFPATKAFDIFKEQEQALHNIFISMPFLLILVKRHSTNLGKIPTEPQTGNETDEGLRRSSIFFGAIHSTISEYQSLEVYIFDPVAATIFRGLPENLFSSMLHRLGSFSAEFSPTYKKFLWKPGIQRCKHW